MIDFLCNIRSGDFIIEYIGEVIDPREFRRRAKEYARDKNKHFYFMALKSDAIIDATQKGNISRFINHSCDPNAETQKWTVNGDLRVGFFMAKHLKSGGEITFDYQFQRYGKEAQRSHCESANCRGWIGEDPDKTENQSNLEKKDRGKDKEKKKKSTISRCTFQYCCFFCCCFIGELTNLTKLISAIESTRDNVDHLDLDEEIEKLTTFGVKNRAQTLNLCRLMVRAEDFEARRSILSVLRNAEQACR